MRVAESAWGDDLAHAARRGHPRIVGEGELDLRIARPRPNELLRHVEDGVACALMRELHDHLPGMDHFARFGADRGDRTRGICDQSGIAQLVLRDAQLRLGGIDLGLGCRKLLLRFIEFGAGYRPSFTSIWFRQKARRVWAKPPRPTQGSLVPSAASSPGSGDQAGRRPGRP